MHTGALVHVLGCLSLWNKHDTHTHTHTGCDTSSEGCNLCLCVTLSFSQTPMICNSSQISFRKRLVYQPAMLHCLSVCCRAMIFYLSFFPLFLSILPLRICVSLYWCCCGNKTADQRLSIFQVMIHQNDQLVYVSSIIFEQSTTELRKINKSEQKWV